MTLSWVWLSGSGLWSRQFSWWVAGWLARYIFSISGCGHIFLQSSCTDLHTITEEVWVSELAPAPGTWGTTKLGGQLSNPSLITWGWSRCTTVTQTIKMQISSPHPSLSPSQFLSVNLHFKPGGLDGSKAGGLNLVFTGMLGQGPQTTVCGRVTGRVSSVQTLESKTYRFFFSMSGGGAESLTALLTGISGLSMQVLLGLHCENSCPGGLRGSLLFIPSFHSHFLTTYTQTFYVCVSVPFKKNIYLFCCSRHCLWHTGSSMWHAGFLVVACKLLVVARGN